MVEDSVIGLILVQELEFTEGDPNEGIEPMDQGDGRKQQDIQSMFLLNMGLFMQQDDLVLFCVVPAHDNGLAPAEGGNPGLCQYEFGTVLQARDGTFPDGSVHPDHRCQSPSQHGQETGPVKDLEIRERGSGRAGRQGRLGSRLRQGTGRQGRKQHRPDPQKRKQETRQRTRQQQNAVQAEKGRPPHHQQEECVEQSQVQAASGDI